jgi:hypothetical protein
MAAGRTAVEVLDGETSSSMERGFTSTKSFSIAAIHTCRCPRRARRRVRIHDEHLSYPLRGCSRWRHENAGGHMHARTMRSRAGELPVPRDYNRLETIVSRPQLDSST